MDGLAEPVVILKSEKEAAEKPAHPTVPGFKEVLEPWDYGSLRAMVKKAVESRTSLVSLTEQFLYSGLVRPEPSAKAISLARLEQLEVDVERLVAHVGAGVPFSRLAAELSRKGLETGVAPLGSADFTVGDWAHEPIRAFSLCRGDASRLILNLSVMTAGGAVESGFDAVPSYGAGYDLTRLFLTSRGTLGIPYGATVTISSVPEARRTIAFGLDSLDALGPLLERVGRFGGTVEEVRATDRAGFALLEPWARFQVPEAEALLEVDLRGSSRRVEGDTALLADLATKAGAHSAEAIDWGIVQTRSRAPNNFYGGLYAPGAPVLPLGGLSQFLGTFARLNEKFRGASGLHLRLYDSATAVLLPLYRLSPPEFEGFDAFIGEGIAREAAAVGGALLANRAAALRTDSPSGVTQLSVLQRIRSEVDPHSVLNPQNLPRR